MDEDNGESFTIFEGVVASFVGVLGNRNGLVVLKEEGYERDILFWLVVKLENKAEEEEEDAVGRLLFICEIGGVEDVDASSSKRIALFWYLNLESGDEE